MTRRVNVRLCGGRLVKTGQLDLQVRLVTAVKRGLLVSLDPLEVMVRLAQLETEARQEILETPGSLEAPDSRDRRVTLGLLVRMVQQVQQGLLDLVAPQGLLETLELQVRRALREVPDQLGRQVIVGQLVILVPLVQREIQAALEVLVRQVTPVASD